jgi:hypothetical protein
VGNDTLKLTESAGEGTVMAVPFPVPGSVSKKYSAATIFCAVDLNEHRHSMMVIDSSFFIILVIKVIQNKKECLYPDEYLNTRIGEGITVFIVSALK